MKAPNKIQNNFYKKVIGKFDQSKTSIILKSIGLTRDDGDVNRHGQIKKWSGP